MAKTIDEVAEERASRYAPPPKYRPFPAGLIGGLITIMAAEVFMAFARLDPEKFSGSLFLTAVVGFLIPAGYFWNEDRKHTRAWVKEYDALRKEQSS